MISIYVSLRRLKTLNVTMRSLPASILLSITLGCLTLSGAGNVLAADQNNAKRLAQFAKLPNWSGAWEPTSSGVTSPPAEPVFTAAWLQKRNAKKPTVPAVDNTKSRCVWGMPRLVKSMQTFEVMVLPEQTFFSYDINEFRHVWTDGRRHSLHVTPATVGYSVGHWEGSTLVIDTIDMQPGLWLTQKGGILSPKATVQERWSQVDNDHLKVDVTVQDSVALAKPFAFSHRYQRTADNHVTQKECLEEMRENNSQTKAN